jgi:hypothetical protein
VLVQGFVSFTGCGGPVLVRLDSRGVLDQRFDLNVARSIAAVSPDHALFFVPALFLRRNSGFALVGDIDYFACTGPLPGRPAGRGLAVGLTADGQIDPSYGKAGRTYFPDDQALGVWAAPGRAGSTVVIMETAASSPSGLPQDLKIRELSSAGLVDPTFGRVGTATVALPAETAGAGIAIGAVPGPDDGVLIGLGSEERVQVVRLES